MAARIGPYLAIIVGGLNLALYFYDRSVGATGSRAGVLIGVVAIAAAVCVLLARRRR